MNCQNCGKPNPTGSRFCQYCGVQISSTSPSPVVTTSESLTTQTQVTRGMPVTTKPSTPIGQLGQSSTSVANIWGPFAGYGMRGRHVSWLLDDFGEKAETLHEAVTERFGERQIPNAHRDWTTLTAKGLVVERRPFYFIKRGITTVALYIARFGRDLYISQVTYVKGPISNFRVAVLALMLLFSLAFTAIFVGGVNDFNPFGNYTDFGVIIFILCIMGPLATLDNFLLGLMLLYSIYKWITEKDFFAILRTPPNEFQQDDTIALETAVEETVRQSLDKVGIDVALMPPAPEKSFGGRPRLI